MKYRKKPLVVDAWKFEGWRQTQWPDWLLDAVEGGRVSFREDGAYITTLEGTMRADAEDWLIRGVKGEIYPCKPHIFDETYSAVADETEPEVSVIEAARSVSANEFGSLKLLRQALADYDRQKDGK